MSTFDRGRDQFINRDVWTFDSFLVFDPEPEIKHKNLNTHSWYKLSVLTQSVQVVFDFAMEGWQSAQAEFFESLARLL